MATAVYLAGKITGDPDFIEKFARAQAFLEKKGFSVFNPATLPQGALEWDGYTNIGLAMLAECSVVCMLPDWTESKGAKLEMGDAVAKRKRILYFEDLLNAQAEAESIEEVRYDL